jgi:hypothetical protein
MATEAPWSEPEFANELERQLGSNWEQLLEGKWGSDWQDSCVRELAYDLGSDWADHPDTAAEKLAELVAETVTEQPAWQEPSAQQQLDPNQPSSIDLGQYAWLTSVAQSGSLRSWLVRIGAQEAQAAELAGESDVAPGRSASVDMSQVDRSRYLWLKTVEESDSLRSWLVRIGVPEDQVAELAEAHQ